ncbi:MAG: DUF2184 domain-containing protein [Scytonema sp. CRU_2_7]|nr:DUF2184 domain-containing protein [Scytonema sp. CRU_2_7]
MRLFAEQLEQARQEELELDEQIPLSLADGRYLTISNEIPRGINSWEIKTYTRMGGAAVILTSATGVPVTNRTVQKISVPVYPIRVGFEVTQEDLETMEALDNVNLLVENLGDNRQALNQKLDLVAYTGEVGTSLQGIANVPNVATIDFPDDGAGASVAWADKTPAQVLRDLNLLAFKVPEQTALTKYVNRILMPATKLIYLQSTPYNDERGESILSVFHRNQAELGANAINEVYGHPALEDLGEAGAGLMIAYNTASRHNRLHIPQGGEFRDIDPPSVIGTTWTITCQMKTAGVEVRKPLEIAYANVE